MSQNAAEPRPVGVILVDSDEDIRGLLRLMLDQDDRFLVAAEANDSRLALTFVSELQPDVVVLNLDTGALDALPLLRRQCPRAAIVLYSAFPDPLTLAAVLMAGADSYLDVGTTWAELLPTLVELVRIDSAEK